MCARARARLWKPTRCTRPSLSEPIRRPAAKLSLRPAGRAKTHPSESTVRRRTPRVLGNTDRGSKTRTWIRRLGFNDSESETRIRRLGFGDSDSKSRIRRLGFGDSDSGTRIRRLGWGLGRECPPCAAAAAAPASPSTPACTCNGRCGARRLGKGLVKGLGKELGMELGKGLGNGLGKGSPLHSGGGAYPFTRDRHPCCLGGICPVPLARGREKNERNKRKK